MDFNADLDWIEDHFKNPEFRANLSEAQMDDLQEKFFELTHLISDYKQASKQGGYEDKLGEVQQDIRQRITDMREIIRSLR